MHDEPLTNSTPGKLGRPLLSIVETKIDVKRGTPTIKFDGEVVHFNIFNAMKYLSDSHIVFTMSVIDPVV